MILVQLYKSGWLQVERNAETPKLADRAIDLLITEVLQGKHGNGAFQLDADDVGDSGARLSKPHFTVRFVHPERPRAVPKPASRRVAPQSRGA